MRIDPANEDTGLYAAGMAFPDRRSLTLDETKASLAHVRRLQVAGMAWLAGIPALALLCTPALLSAAVAPPVKGALLLGTVIGAASLAGQAARDLRRARSLRRDVARGEVAIHAGGAEDPQGEATRRVEMLPESGLVLCVDGDPQTVPVALEQVRVANVPAAASLAAQWLQPPQAGGDDFLCNRRDLSPAERQEIARHQVGMIRPHWLLLPLYDLYYLVGLWQLFRAPAVASRDALYWLVMTGVLVWVHRHPLRHVLLALRLKRDATAGTVEVVQMVDAAAEEPQPIFEVLPHSRVVWTKDGTPAPWRTVRNPRVG